MRLTVLGGCGAWPTVRQACSGYVIEHDGFILLIDPGYATLPELIGRFSVDEVDAALISHGHPDHCADLNPLLRARKLGGGSAPALPIYAPHDALNAVLALDEPDMLADSYVLRPFEPGEHVTIGPLGLDTWALPHHVPNAGLRVSADGAVLAYTGDSGLSDNIVDLAEHADLFVAEATFVSEVADPKDAPFLMTARGAGLNAARAGVKRLLLTHLWPGTDPTEALRVARRVYDGPVDVASPGLVIDI